MLRAEEKAIDVFNRSLKVCIVLGIDPNKANAKEIALNACRLAKEVLIDTETLDDIPAMKLQKSINRHNEVIRILEERF